MRRWPARVVAMLAILPLLVTSAQAQSAAPARPAPTTPPAARPVRPRTTPFPPDLANEGALIQSVTLPSPVSTQRAIEPLPLLAAQRLQRAIAMRASGLPERARDTLLVLQREHPHHALVVTELGRAQLAREDWREVERLAVTERSALRDSALLGPELATALERLARPREALRTAIEAWTVSPADGGWALGVILRLAPLDARAAATSLAAIATPRPWRSDLAIGLARLHAASGHPADAVRVLVEGEKRSGHHGLRVLFADGSLREGTTADTTAALAVLTDLTADPGRKPEERLATARRAWAAVQASGLEGEWAPRLALGLREIPGERWGPEFLLSLVRALQHTAHPAEARALLTANPALERRMPELTLERASGLAREGALAEALPLLDSLARSWPAARFTLAEVQFFAGELDSAHANYDLVAAQPEDPDAAQALDRMYLLEDMPASPLRPMLGVIAFERWRGGRAAATALADSLWRRQSPRGEYAAHAGLELAALRAEAGDLRGALVPLLVIGDSLADDRLAPLARQRAGDAYAALGEDKNALAQYEECLARYPRAWNSAEVRRRVERLRREKRL